MFETLFSLAHRLADRTIRLAGLANENCHDPRAASSGLGSTTTTCQIAPTVWNVRVGLPRDLTRATPALRVNYYSM